MKRLVVKLCLFICLNSAYSNEYKVFFTHYVITNHVAAERINEMSRDSFLSANDVQYIEKSAAFRDEHSAVTSKKRLDVESLLPIAYVEKVKEKYEIVYSDKCQGLSCAFGVDGSDGSNSSGAFIYLDGPFQFYSLVEREFFDPFPNLKGGRPVTVIGVRKNNLLIRGGESAIGSFGMACGADGVITSLVMMLVRYETIGEEEE